MEPIRIRMMYRYGMALSIFDCSEKRALFFNLRMDN